MLSLLAAACCFQADGPKLKTLWTLDSQLKIENRTTNIKTLAKWRDGKTIRIMTDISTGGSRPGEQMPPQWFCSVDMATGAQAILNTFSDSYRQIDGKYVREDYGMSLDGTVWHGRSGGEEYQGAIIDPATYNTILELTPGDFEYPGFADEERAVKMVLPRGKCKLQSLGDAQVLWDSPKVRLMLVNGELRSYKPLTLTQDGDPLLTATSVPGVKSWKDAALIGDPDQGPIAIRVPTADGNTTVFLDSDWNLIPGTPNCSCLDAGPNGFLIGPATAMSRPLAACLDPKSGKQKWALPQPFIGQPLFWVGNKAITINPSGRDTSNLDVLDGETGKLLAEDPLPASPMIIKWTSGNFILLMNFQNKYYGCELSDS